MEDSHSVEDVTEAESQARGMAMEVSLTKAEFVQRLNGRRHRLELPVLEKPSTRMITSIGQGETKIEFDVTKELTTWFYKSLESVLDLVYHE
jgi:hypothetical protein